MTKEVNPEEAQRLGPALGVEMTKAWVISGIPSYADSGMITTTLAQSIQAWPGWVVRPKRPLTANRGRLSTWLVESAAEPPTSVITLNNYIIQIEAYVDRSPTSKRARAWLDIKPKPQHKIVPGQIYEDSDHQHTEAPTPMEIESPVGRAQGASVLDGDVHQNARQDVPKGKSRDGKDIIMQDTSVTEVQQQQTPAKKRVLDESGACSGRTEAEDDVAKLRDRLEKKETQIDTLLKTIQDLTAQVAALRALMEKMQQGQATLSEGSTAEGDENL